MVTAIGHISEANATNTETKKPVGTGNRKEENAEDRVVTSSRHNGLAGMTGLRSGYECLATTRRVLAAAASGQHAQEESTTRG